MNSLTARLAWGESWGRTMWLVGVAGLAACVALLTVAAAGEKVLWAVALQVLMLGAATMLGVRRRKQLLLDLYVVALPISIGKTLFVAGDYYWYTLTLNAADLALLPYLALVLVESLSRPNRVVIPRGWHAALCYVAWMWVTALLSGNPLGAAMAAITLTKAVVVYFVLANELKSAADVRRVLMAFGIGLLVQFPVVAMQLLQGTGLTVSGARTASIGMKVAVGDAAAFRPPGLTRHPNELADYPLFLIPTALLLLCAPVRVIARRVRLAAIVVLGIGGAILVISLSRGAWIAGAASVLFTMLVARRRALVRPRHLRYLAGLAFGTVAAVAVVYPAAIKRATGDDQRSTQVRLAMFEQALLIFRSHPVAGVGLGGYYTAAKTYVPESFGQYSPALREGITGNVVHNKYLLVLAEHGVIGLVVLLSLYFAFFRAWVRQRVWSDPGRMIVALGLTGSLVAQLVFYSFEHFYFGFRTDALWLTFGLLAALYRQEDDVRVLESRRMAFASPPERAPVCVG